MSKDLTIVIAASGDRKDVTIEPGTTAEDIIRSVGLEGYVLSRDGSSSNIFDPRENVYPEVEDGEKLWASTKPDVGSERATALSPSFHHSSGPDRAAWPRS